MFRINRSLAVAVSLMVALLVSSACGSSEPKAAPQAAWSGTWATDVSFGNATVTVNKDGTLVTGISYKFHCGSASSATGSIGATKDNPGWPIDKGGNFGFKNLPFYFNLLGDGTSNTTATMSGQFASGGKSASGEWNLAVNDGTRCSSKWSSTR